VYYDGRQGGSVLSLIASVIMNVEGVNLKIWGRIKNGTNGTDGTYV
jgi:hypothetical protein